MAKQMAVISREQTTSHLLIQSLGDIVFVHGYSVSNCIIGTLSVPWVTILPSQMQMSTFLLHNYVLFLCDSKASRLH